MSPDVERGRGPRGETGIPDVQSSNGIGDKLRKLHRLTDLGFPGVPPPRHSLDSDLAGAILREYPTAEALHSACRKKVTRLRYDGRHKVGDELAGALLGAAKVSVGHHDGPACSIRRATS